jgi:hypothetical protein
LVGSGGIERRVFRILVDRTMERAKPGFPIALAKAAESISIKLD